MLQTTLRSPASELSRAKLEEVLASPGAEGFVDWLYQQGYRPSTVAEFLRSLPAWTDWMRAAGLSETNVHAGFEAYKLQLSQHDGPRHGSNIGQRSLRAASRFIRYLEDKGVVGRREPPPSPIAAWPLLGEFRAWMREHRGLTEPTLDVYQGILIGLVETIGITPSSYTPEKLRDFVLQRARSRSVEGARTIVAAVRALLRFLGATGRCPAGLEYAIPGFAAWRLSSVPKFLGPVEVEQLIASCADDNIGRRNRAVLLLLARLGLRASDVAHLKFDDIDWCNGKIIVCGKGRHHEWLPLTQEVGDSILLYILYARPPLPVPQVFTRALAPLGPLSRLGITEIVRTALQRTGIKSPINGAHVLRHSAAAAMLQQGMSLAGIGAVLRHRSSDTTARYAKVDLRLLSEITQPWPEGPSC